MMSTLFLKTLYDKRWFVLGWSIALCAMVVLVLSFYPAFSEDNTFEALSKNVPSQFKELVGDADSFKTISGYISQQLFDIRIPLLFMIMAIILGIGLSVGEEEKGTLRTTLVLPISRVRIVAEKWLAATVIMAVTALAVIAGIYIGLAIINEMASMDLIWQLGLLSWLFGISAAAIPLGVGLLTGNRAITMALAILTTIGSFILSTFGQAVDWLEPFEKYSLMHYYDATKIVDGGIPGSDIIVLGGIFIVMFIVASTGFRYRDVA